MKTVEEGGQIGAQGMEHLHTRKANPSLINTREKEGEIKTKWKPEDSNSEALSCIVLLCAAALHLLSTWFLQLPYEIALAKVLIYI